MSTDQWAEGVCMVPSTMVGVQFRGDENDGWKRRRWRRTLAWQYLACQRARCSLFGSPRFAFCHMSSGSSRWVKSVPRLPAAMYHVSIYAVVLPD
ncbi:MAG: hypothetical protein R2867_31055 [Caldilineaceae bacterium]